MSPKAQNCVWPLQLGGRGWVSMPSPERYAHALRQLLTTVPGELLWAPTYGTHVTLIRTQDMGEDMADILRGEVEQAVAEWIPEISVVGLTVDRHSEEQKLVIRVGYVVKSNAPSRGPALTRTPSWVTVTS